MKRPRLEQLLPNMITATGITKSQEAQERGVALLMVIFLLAIASALLISLADSSYVSMRLNGATERRVQAEYLLKSAVNLAKVLIKSDTTPGDDPQQDAWMKFAEGADVPGALLGLTGNVKISLQISSEAGKIPIRRLVQEYGPPNEKYKSIFTQLFKALGFDLDTKEVMQTGRFKGKHFTSEEMVANLIDYMDSDKESYSAPNFAQGVEASLPDDEQFRNEQIDSLASELSSIPGFTPSRVQKILPHVTTMLPTRININAASREVIQSLSPNITADMADKIVTWRSPANGGPFTEANKGQELQNLIGLPGNDIQTLVAASGQWFEVIAKVDYGTSYYMARAVLKSNGPGRLPLDRGDFELY